MHFYYHYYNSSNWCYHFTRPNPNRTTIKPVDIIGRMDILYYILHDSLKTILILSYILVSILAVKLVAVVVPWRELEKRKVVF